jgi:uncharacterized membrane protein
MAIWKQPTTYVLCGLLCVGAFLRFDRISKENLWVDEYWALYLATGRGNTIFDIPLNTVIRSAPAANFADAPHWWHIWNGLATTPHPPLYHLMLRGWVDLFGDGDRATRAMSAMFGLAGILLIFDLGRALHGKLAGIFAAGIMTFAPTQIDFSQQVRPYTMLAFIGLILWRSLILIEQKGPSRIRLLVLALGVAGAALTHYFSLGVIAAAACYAGFRFRGEKRKSVLLAIVASLLLAAMIWSPFAWKTHYQYIVGPDFGKMGVALTAAVIDAPRKLVFGTMDNPVAKTVMGWALAVIVYFSPAFRIRRDPRLLPAWLWTVGGIGFVLAIDLIGDTQFVDLPKYIFVSSPAIYLILAAPWGNGVGRLLPPALLLATILYGVDRWQAGPQFSESTAVLARLIEQKVGADDAVIITGQFDSEPAFRYFIISHYAGDWRHPVVLLTQPLDGKTGLELATFHRVWVVGRDSSEMERFLPGWRITDYHGIAPGFSFWAIQPAK